MTIIRIKGYDINAMPITNSFDRRALQFKNNIISNLRKLGLTEDDVEIPLEKVAMKRAKASAEWYMEGYRLYYSYNSRIKFVENLYIVSKVIENEVNSLLNEQKTFQEFYKDFSEDDDVEEKRKEAREILGVSHDSNNMEEINKKYKELAKKLHPDKEDGCLETFKKINNAHKVLKRELS
jgi:hypothetical protein